MAGTEERTTSPARVQGSTAVRALVGVAVVLVLGAATRFLEQTVPAATEGSAFGGVAAVIEYPVYAIALGLLGNVVLTQLGLRERLAAGFRTEFFIKTGLVLLGASINIAVIVRAAGPAIVQALVLISVVFGFTWWLGGRLGLDDELRALLASAVSICGVSAAIAAAGAVHAKREQLAYTASLVVLFALPSIFLLPALVDAFGLGPAVGGAWVGGNIDTTAAVSAAGAIVGEEALQIATIVKTTQNALLGVVAVALTAYFAFRVERSVDSPRPRVRELWERFVRLLDRTAMTVPVLVSRRDRDLRRDASARCRTNGSPARPTPHEETPVPTHSRESVHQSIADRLLTSLEELVHRHRALAGADAQQAALHAELIAAELAHELAVARSALQRHPRLH